MKKELIDAVKAALFPEFAKIHEQVEGMEKRFDKRFDEIGIRFAEVNGRIDKVEALFDYQTKQNDKMADSMLNTNGRLDQLFNVVVRREEHYVVAERMARLEQEVERIKEKLLAG